MNKKPKKNITLDDLAGIMQAGFVKADENFVKAEKNTDKKIDNLAGMVQRGFLGIDEKFKGIDEKFEGIDEKFKGIDEKFGEINNKIDNLDLKMSSWISIYRSDIEILDKKLSGALERIEDLEYKTGLRLKTKT